MIVLQHEIMRNTDASAKSNRYWDASAKDLIVIVRRLEAFSQLRVMYL
jgi:hypothetical protein